MSSISGTVIGGHVHLHEFDNEVETAYSKFRLVIIGIVAALTLPYLVAANPGDLSAGFACLLGGARICHRCG